MPAFGLAVLAVGAVLLYCGYKDLSVSEFLASFAGGPKAQPVTGRGGTTSAPSSGTKSGSGSGKESPGGPAKPGPQKPKNPPPHTLPGVHP